MPIELTPLPPKEAVEYFRQKGYKVGFDYRDVWQEEHQAAFTVAKAMNLDILKDIRAEVDKALAEGVPFEQFRANLKPVLQQKGWWGVKPMQDPLTGEVKEVQLGSTRRLKTIYNTNLRTAHSEGQWQRIQATKGTFPYLEYSGGHSAHPRHLHLSWTGMILPVDDPFWQAHYPVKDWGCKCRVIPRTENQLKKSGRQVSQAPDLPTYTYVNKRTGEVQQIPEGVDPSFHYPPGGRRAALNGQLASKVDGADRPLAVAAVNNLVGSQAWQSFYTKPEGHFPIAVLPQGDADLMQAGTLTVRLSADTMQKQLKTHPELTAGEYDQVQAAIDNGERIQDGKSLIYVLDTDSDLAGGYVTVVKATKTGKALYLTSLRRLSRKKALKDMEIARLLDKKK